MKRLIALLFTALALSAGAATAQDKYPSRAVKVIVPYAPGGATDIVARIIGDEFQKITAGLCRLNKPGAFGMLAIEEMVKAAPDGYTLMIGNVSTNTITPIIYAKKMNFDYSKSVVAVTNLSDVPAFLLVTTANDFPVKSVPSLSPTPRRTPARSATAPSASAPIRIMTWHISPSALAASTWLASRTRMALQA